MHKTMSLSIILMMLIYIAAMAARIVNPEYLVGTYVLELLTFVLFMALVFIVIALDNQLEGIEKIVRNKK